jgi:type I restriction enzyme R subunit
LSSRRKSLRHNGGAGHHDHIASSCSIRREDFDYAELADKGGLQKAWSLFGEELDTLINGLNEELVV